MNSESLPIDVGKITHNGNCEYTIFICASYLSNLPFICLSIYLPIYLPTYLSICSLSSFYYLLQPIYILQLACPVVSLLNSNIFLFIYHLSLIYRPSSLLSSIILYIIYFLVSSVYLYSIYLLIYLSSNLYLSSIYLPIFYGSTYL